MIKEVQLLPPRVQVKCDMNFKNCFQIFIVTAFCSIFQNAHAMDIFSCPSERVQDTIDWVVPLQYEYCAIAEHFASFNVGEVERQFDEFGREFDKYVVLSAQKAHTTFTHQRFVIPVHDALLQGVKDSVRVFVTSFMRKYNKDQINHNFLVSPEQMREYVEWYKDFYAHSIIKIATGLMLDQPDQGFDKPFVSGLCRALKQMGYEAFVDDAYKQYFTGPVFIDILEHIKNGKKDD